MNGNIFYGFETALGRMKSGTGFRRGVWEENTHVALCVAMSFSRLVMEPISPPDSIAEIVNTHDAAPRPFFVRYSKHEEGEESRPYAFTSEDILANDWQPVD